MRFHGAVCRDANALLRFISLSSHAQTFIIQSRVDTEAEQYGDAPTPQYSVHITDERQQQLAPPSCAAQYIEPRVQERLAG